MPDIELPQVGLVTNSTSSTVQPLTATSKLPTDVVELASTGDKKAKKEPVVQQRSSDGFSQLFSSASVSSIKTKDSASFLSTVKSSLPPRPADYDDFWYQADNGNWYNEYDDMGYEFADEEILVVEEQETTLTPQATLDAKGNLKNEQQKKSQPEVAIVQESNQSTKRNVNQVVTSEKSVKKPPRPDDYDDYWYQDDNGQWKNEYDDLGYNFEDEDDEEFYTEEELAKEEAELFKQKDRQEQQQPKIPPKISQVDKKSEEVAVKPVESNKVIMPQPGPPPEKKKPADYEDHWFQDFDGNWYNEYDQLEEKTTATTTTTTTHLPTAVSTISEADSQNSNSISASKKEKKTVSFDKEDVQEQLTTSTSGRSLWRNPKDRWQWAFTRIIQVGCVGGRIFNVST